jgi:hypothetical protein
MLDKIYFFTSRTGSKITQYKISFCLPNDYILLGPGIINGLYFFYNNINLINNLMIKIIKKYFL